MLLVRLIEGEIIPRLLLAHEAAAPPAAGRPSGSAGRVSASQVTYFSQLVATRDAGDALAYVEGLISHGATTESIYFDLLSPSAKLLGLMWEQDLCSFADVTVGLCRLQQIVYDLAAQTPGPQPETAPRSALFTLTPGDQHAFGLVLVAETFRQAGWRTTTAPDASAAELLEAVAVEPFDVLGFSMASETWLEPLPKLIAEMRRVSRNPFLRVLVGGRVFSENPRLYAEVGADAAADDARGAVACANGLLDRPVGQA